MPVNRKRVQRVLRTLLAPPGARRRPWAVAEPDTITGAWYPNLRASVVATGPNQVWVADLTYVRVAGTFAYLAIILDAWSRRVIGYAVGPVLDARLPLAALEAAVEARRPPTGCVHHSDRGTQYASRRYREALTAAGLRGSMSRAGNPYDNAQAESLMKTLKHDEIYLRHYRTMDDVLRHLSTYLEHTYNEQRLHSARGYLLPAAFEALHQQTLSGQKPAVKLFT